MERAKPGRCERNGETKAARQGSEGGSRQSEGIYLAVEGLGLQDHKQAISCLRAIAL